MKLEIRLFGGLVCSNTDLPSYAQSEFTLDVPACMTVQDLRELLSLGAGPLLIAVNGVMQKKDCPLSDDDRIGIFPPIAGG